MDLDEKRWLLAIALAPMFVKAFRGEEFDVTSSKPKALWDTVDAIAAGEPKPAEAPSDDGSRRIDPEYHPTIADYRVALMQLDELEARAQKARIEADGWQHVAGKWKAKAEAAEAALSKAASAVDHDERVVRFEKARAERLIAEGWQASAEAAEAQLTEAREIIAIMEEREVKRDEQETVKRERDEARPSRFTKADIDEVKQMTSEALAMSGRDALESLRAKLTAELQAWSKDGRSGGSLLNAIQAILDGKDKP